MQTITTQYSVQDQVWFIDKETNKILSGVVDKIYICVYADLDNVAQINIRYLVKASDDLFYATTEDLMADNTIDLLDIIQINVDNSIC